MKKVNLIKRLWTDSHEKQSPQRFGRYAAMLIMLLTLGVGQMWAGQGYNGESHVYLNVDGTTNYYEVTHQSWNTGSSLPGDWGGVLNEQTFNNVLNIQIKGGAVGGWTESDGNISGTLYYKVTTNTTTPSSGWTTVGGINANYTTKSGNNCFRYKNDYSVNVTPTAPGTYYLHIKITDGDSNNRTSYVKIVVPSFTVAGSSAVLGSNWDATDTGNDMTFSSGTSYTLTKTNVTLETGTTYECKVVLNHDWDEGAYPGSNKTFTVAANGHYNVTFSFNASTQDVSVSTTRLYAVIYNDNGKTSGSVPATSYHANGAKVTVASNSGSLAKTGYSFGGWNTNPSGTGTNYTAGSGTFTMGSSDKNLYAKWNENMSTVTLTASPSSKGTFTVGSTPNQTSTTAGVTTTRSVTAVPISGYHFVSWAISGGATISSTTTNPTTVTGDGTGDAATLTATFAADDVYSLTVAAGTGISAVSGNTNDIKAGQSISISATVATGYIWNTWTKTAGSGTLSTFTAGTKNQTVTVGTAGDITLTASATENMSSLTTSNHYDAGNPSYAAPTVSNSATTVGYVTTRTITAATPGTGYVFAGWTLTNCTRTDGGGATTNPITIRSNGDGAAATVVANYEEVLTQSTWVLKGGTAFGDDWVTEHALTKKTGHSTESVVYHTFNIASTNTGDYNAAFNFKLVKKGATDDYFGIATTNHESEWWYGRTSGEQTMSTGGGVHDNVQLRADVAGPYEVKIDYSTPSSPTVTVTFPTSYTLTYSLGTVPGTSGSISTSPSTASGSKVLSGSTVTLTAPSEKTGYSWKGWYPNADGSGVQQCSTKAYAVTMNADKTLYACYTEDMHDVTVNVTGSGTVSYGAGAASSSCTATAGIATASNTIHAIPAAGYAFVGWTGVSAEEKNHITDYTATWNSTNEGWDLTVKADAATTIVANFAPRFALVGAIYTDGNPAGGMPGWDLENAVAFTYSAGTYTLTRGLTSPNTTYAFKIIDRRAETWIWRGYSEASNNLPVDNSTTYTLTVNGGNNVYFDTRAAGDYTFTVVEETITGVKYPNVKIACPTSRQITIGQKSIYDPAVTNTSDATTTGGNVTAEDNLSNTITTGQYVADGANVTFTAHPATGYAFKGWYQNADCTTPYVDNRATENTVVIDAEAKALTLNNITENKAVYAKYEEIMTRIAIMTYGGKFSVDGGAPTETYHDPYLQVGVKTTHTVSIASEDAGHYFSNWELSASEEEDVNFSISGSAEDEDNRSITVTGLGYETRTHLNFLEPKFKQLESIYFRNIFDDGETVTHWENVYVCFDITWADYDGKQAAQTSTYNTSKNLHVQMEGGSNYIYRAYVPRYITRNNKSNVAFVNYDPNYADGTGNYLYNGIACSRGDYCPKHNMFVPYHEKSYDANSVAYYNSGYWMHYSITQGVDAGYWIERRTGTNTYSGKPADQFVIVKRAYEDNPSIQYRLRIDNVGNDKYAIFSEGGLKYKAASTITHSACDGIEVGEDNSDDAYFVLTPTAEGEYIITLDQSGDKMKISVEYPVVRGDYVLEHTYTGRNKANTADSTYTTRTNVIKASTAGTNTRYSMYLNKKGATLKLRKCESINASGEPQWSTGSTTNVNFITDVLNEIGDGVYQFDLTVAADALATVDSVRLYTGNFYIKTDAADGGWVAYKKNILDKNTVNFDRTSATYDNYFCKYFASKDWNIKSVIANDYCNQLSDTVKGDGIARMVGTEPYVPVDGTSIRFSYNSATNETKRAYLGASEKNDFLNLVEDQAAEKVYRMIDATTYDLHNITGYDNLWKTKFADNGNWVYEMDLKVKPSAQAGVSAAYTDASKIKHEQVLIPSTNTVLGGSSSSTNLYSIRIVYDFKTNFMMSAFILDGEEITEALSDFDMLWVRHKDDAAQEVILGTGGSMTNVRVIGAVEFQYNEMYWLSESGSKVDLSSWTSVSRPYLKYFISFPFDVEMNSIFGLNQSYYGLDYVIQKYDGTKRAKEGLFLGDGDNYWVNMEMGDTLKANEGYCLILDNDYASGRFGRWWDNKGVGSSVYLYFPAMEKIASITATGSTVVPEHTCTIDRTWGDGGKKNHMNTDSHWNMIGSPLFCNAYIKDTTASSPYHMSSYYELDYSTNKWVAKATRETPCFKAMSSRFVQWYGTIGWTNDAEQNIFKAPRRAAENENYFAKIEVTLNNQRDYTYLEMIDGADKGFILREDMMKFYNSGVPQICTFAEGYDVAYNKLPVENTTVALGLVARKNGTYTFSMPTNFSGTVTLIDNFAQTRTNLAMEDYEVYLEKGTIDDRFELEINVNKMPTAIDGAEDGSGSLKDGKAHKFIMNGVMYILENGRIYDAQGNRVK